MLTNVTYFSTFKITVVFILSDTTIKVQGCNPTQTWTVPPGMKKVWSDLKWVIRDGSIFYCWNSVRPSWQYYVVEEYKCKTEKLRNQSNINPVQTELQGYHTSGSFGTEIWSVTSNHADTTWFKSYLKVFYKPTLPSSMLRWCPLLYSAGPP